jgi:hypothetical protein
MYSQKAGQFIVYIFAIIGFVLIAGFTAVNIGWTNTAGIIDKQRASFLNLGSKQIASVSPTWKDSEEWQTLKTAIIRDATTIYKVSYEAEIDPRLIVSILVPEQLRLFHSEREIFKKIFAPLKILGNQSQFSWGIMGIKQETAKMIEEYLKDSTSPFYLGQKYEDVLNFETENVSEERFARITNEKDHYYGYLYGAIYLREIMNQWLKAGFDISHKPEILGTLYNIGFINSKPNKNPQIGGAEINLGGKTYSFGGLAGEFYYSNELVDLFPLK